MALIQQWKCQDNAASTVVVATVGNNGTLVGGDNTSAITVGDGPGTAFTRSLDLDGTNDYIDISAASLSFVSGTAFSFAAWIKFDSVAATDAFIGIDGASTSRVVMTTTVVVVTGSSGSSNYTVPAFSTGVWYHLLVTRTTGNSVRVFVGGVESTPANSIAQTFVPARIGRANTARHNGKICDVRVYNTDESANVAAIMAEKDTAGPATVTKTIKASGGDYASPAAAATAFNAGTISGAIAGDNIVFNIIENVAYDSTFLITANPTGYASYTLTVDPTVRHNGTYGSGARLAISTAVRSACSDSVAALNGTIEWLEITKTGSGKIACGFELAAAFSASYTKTVRNCMIHDNGASVLTPFRCHAIGTLASNGPSCNLRVLDTLVSNWTSGTTTEAIGIQGNSGSGATVDILNCTVDGIDVVGSVAGVARGIVIENQANKTTKNCVVTRVGLNTTNGTKTCFSGNGGSTVGATNASDDATAFGSGSLTSIVRGNNLSAPDSGDYRPLNDTCAIFGVGTDIVITPTGVNLDLKGRDRDATGDAWSIGAYQLSAGGTVANSIDLAIPTAYRIYKRAAGVAPVVLSGVYAGTPTNIEVQVDGGSWATLQSGPTAGVFSGTVNVAEGTRSLAVRFSNATSVTDSVSNVLVGDVFFVAGQSNADGRLTNNQSYTHASQKAAVFDFDDFVWRELIDPCSRVATGTPWPLLATQIMAHTGVPVGFVLTGETGLLISLFWTTSQQSKWTSSKLRVTASGVNGVTAVLWDLGETDAIADTLEVDFNSRLDGLAGDVNSAYGCPLIVAQTGTTTGIDADSDLDAIRSAQTTAWGDNASVKPGPIGYDRADLHWVTDAEGLTLAARWWLAIEAAIYSGANGRGPRFSTATLNSGRTTIAVVFDRVLKTGLTFGTGAWTVLDNGTPATVSGVAYHGTNTSAVVLTLSGALSGAANTCTLYLASGNDATAIVVPKSTDISMPSGSAVQIPAEPFWGVVVTEAGYIPTRYGANAGMLALTGGITQ